MIDRHLLNEFFAHIFYCLRCIFLLLLTIRRKSIFNHSSCAVYLLNTTIFQTCFAYAATSILYIVLYLYLVLILLIAAKNLLKIVLWWAKIILIGTTCSPSFRNFLILLLLSLFIKIDLISKLSSLPKLIAISSLNRSKCWLTWFLLWNCITYQFYINIFLFLNLLFLC